MKVAIVGYGIEGAASYDYYLRQGDEVTICDQNAGLETPASALVRLGDGYLDNLDRFDLIVRTAGISPRLILDHNPRVEGKITTHLNEFLRVCPTRNIIGVTGTKGKGTTTTLIGKMLEAAGKQVYVGGNIGVSPLSFLDKLTPESWVVLELSSFQLQDVCFSPHIGVCLMVAPEHLNWHANLEEYYLAKSRLFARQTADDIAIYFADSEASRRIAGVGQGRKVPYFAEPGAMVRDDAIWIDGHELCLTEELQLLGRHNWQNACAAVTAVWQVTQDEAAIKSVLVSFTGLEHRLELVRELDGVRYYDDSFGTTPETAIVALEAFDGPKIIILGGSDKGASYDELAQAIRRSSVRKVLLIGEQANAIRLSLEAAGLDNYEPGGNNMTDIVNNARRLAQSGDVVILSPACASFDMFANYKDRGNQFKAVVRALA